MKKILSILLASAALTLPAIAQAANDGFLVPLDEDLTNAITAAPAGTGGGYYLRSRSCDGRLD